MTEQAKRGPGRPRKNPMGFVSDDPEKRPAPPAEPCGTCFPQGWAGVADHVVSLGCEHGTVMR